MKKEIGDRTEVREVCGEEAEGPMGTEHVKGQRNGPGEGVRSSEGGKNGGR